MFEFLKRHKWEILIICIEFMYMALELLASRLLSPYFGTGIEAWTAILSVILFGSAIGNNLGGKFASSCESMDKKTQYKLKGLVFYDDELVVYRRLSYVLLMLSLFFGLLPVISSVSIFFMGLKHRIVAVLVSAFFCVFFPGLCIGFVSPVAVSRYSLSNNAKIGFSSSTISIAMTFGGIVGTLLTGFWLVPTFGAANLSYFMSIFSALLALWCIRPVGFLCYQDSGYTWVLVLAGLFISSCVASIVYDIDLGHIVQKKTLDVQTGSQNSVDTVIDTKYGHAQVKDGFYNGAVARFLIVDNGYESAIYGKDKLDELVFGYSNVVGEIMSNNVNSNSSVLCLGGGAYSMPQWLLRKTDASNVTVVEIDPGVTEIARKYFGLSESEKSFGNRLRLFNDDGRVYINTTEEKYDIIFNDTYAGMSPARGLVTQEAIQHIHDALNEDGLFVINAIGIAEMEDESLLYDEVETLKSVFSHVYVLWFSDEARSPYARANHILVATDSDTWKPPATLSEETLVAGSSRILTDDDSPVEVLSARES